MLIICYFKKPPKIENQKIKKTKKSKSQKIKKIENKKKIENPFFNSNPPHTVFWYKRKKN